MTKKQKQEKPKKPKFHEDWDVCITNRLSDDITKRLKPNEVSAIVKFAEIISGDRDVTEFKLYGRRIKLNDKNKTKLWSVQNIELHWVTDAGGDRHCVIQRSRSHAANVFLDLASQYLLFESLGYYPINSVTPIDVADRATIRVQFEQFVLGDPYELIYWLYMNMATLERCDKILPSDVNQMRDMSATLPPHVRSKIALQWAGNGMPVKLNDGSTWLHDRRESQALVAVSADWPTFLVTFGEREDNGPETSFKIRARDLTLLHGWAICCAASRKFTGEPKIQELSNDHVFSHGLDAYILDDGSMLMHPEITDPSYILGEGYKPQPA